VDDSIYAGGTLTKFSRVHGKGQLMHERYCAKDTGSYLADCVLQKVDPLSIGDVEPDDLPVFGSPRSVSARLPGGYCYGRVSLPKVPDNCTSMITGGIGGGTINRYTVLKLDGKGIASELVYLGLEKVEVQNLSKLIGLQEAYLNSATSTYEKGLVECWIDFFREDWASALYHDRFSNLQTSLRTLLKTDEGAYEIIDMLVRGAEEGKEDDTLVAMRRSAVGPGGSVLMPSTKKLIETNALEFVRKNKALLPRYLLPVAAAPTVL
jgi:hypothetical protein